jgi:ornithine carbamoyltransferase
MESKPIPTAEQFIKRLCPLSKTLTIEGAINLAHEYAVLFARHHVKEALKEAVDNAELVYTDGCGSHVDEDSILNAYAEDRIK